MTRNSISIVMVWGLMLACGCKDESAKPVPGAVGVVDLERIGKVMGWNEVMQNNLQETERVINEDIEAHLKPLRTAMENKRDEIVKGNNLNKEQTDKLNHASQRSELEKLGLNPKQIDELGETVTAYATQVTAAQQRFNQVVAAHRDALGHAYRVSVEPVVRRVAVASGRSVVIAPSPALIYTEPGSDLTDKVIDELQHSATIKVELPPIPHIGAPTTMPTTKPG